MDRNLIYNRELEAKYSDENNMNSKLTRATCTLMQIHKRTRLNQQEEERYIQSRTRSKKFHRNYEF